MMKGTQRNSLFFRRRRVQVLTSAAFLLLSCTAVAAQAVEGGNSESFGELFLTYGVPILFVAGLVGLVIYRKVTSAKTDQVARPRQRAQMQAGSKKEAPASAQGGVEGDRQQRSNASSIETPVAQDLEQSAFGAYRIDQEVGKLVLGKAHRMDVMASRVPDDRRAIEASLIKALNASDTDDQGRQRASQALEEYGFVARQSAVLLQGRDAWERSSAARVLGQIGSPSSLPSLIEALHDADSIVRNQAVASLGQLKDPAAIGALLDIARRHADIPPSLLSESLSSCSVDTLGYLDSSSYETGQNARSFGSESQELAPIISFEELPTGDEDDALLGLMTKLESSDAKERAQVARDLGSRPSQRSVTALCATALNDTDASVRSAAVTALGSINHESVFAAVLVALADVTREVRAAAARTLSSLHFDRAQAYARLLETGDDATIQSVARACVETGIVAQMIDRLASEDRRQAQEAFTLFSLLAKAGEIQPILDVIQNHRDVQVRLCAVRVLNANARANISSQLRDLVAVEGLPEDVSTALLEVLYKLDKEQPVT